jgi:hypothetical protein
VASEIKMATDDQVVTETIGDNQEKTAAAKAENTITGQLEAKLGKSVLYYASTKHNMNRDHLLAHGFILGRNP